MPGPSHEGPVLFLARQAGRPIKKGGFLRGWSCPYSSHSLNFLKALLLASSAPGLVDKGRMIWNEAFARFMEGVGVRYYLKVYANFHLVKQNSIMLFILSSIFALLNPLFSISYPSFFVTGILLPW